MRTMLIFKTEILHVIRNKRNLIMMILFPLVMILILGAVLSQSFEGGNAPGDIGVLYLAESPGATALGGFIHTGSGMGLRFHEASDRSQGMDEIANGDFACFIYDGPQGLTLYKNSRHLLEANLAEAALTAYLRRAQALSAIGAVAPAKAAELGPGVGPDGLIAETSVNSQRQPKAIDYYAVTMLTMVIMFSSTIGVAAIKRENLSHTSGRLLCSPVKRREIMTGKILGTMVVGLLQVIAVILASKLLFHAYWGERPGVVIGLLMSEVAMVTGLGIGLAFMIKNHLTINNLINLISPVLACLGGCFSPVEGFGAAFQRLAVISPLRWLNEALFQTIYGGDLAGVLPAVALNLLIAVVFLGAASLLSRKEAFLG